MIIRATEADELNPTKTPSKVRDSVCPDDSSGRSAQNLAAPSLRYSARQSFLENDCAGIDRELPQRNADDPFLSVGRSRSPVSMDSDQKGSVAVMPAVW